MRNKCVTSKVVYSKNIVNAHHTAVEVLDNEGSVK